MSIEEVSLLRHLQRGISETTEENVVFTTEITSLLSKINFDIKTLPNDIKEALEKLALILKSQRLLEFDETALRVAKEQKIIREKKQQREEKQMSLIHDKLLKNIMKLHAKLDHLQSTVVTLKDTIDHIDKDKDNLYCNKVFLSTKLKEYQQAVEKLETDLSSMQIDDLYPEKILNKYNLYLERKGKLANLNESLAQYGELPPNLLQAELLMKSKKKEYEKLKQLFLEETY